MKRAPLLLSALIALPALAAEPAPTSSMLKPSFQISAGTASARFGQVAAFLAEQLTQNRNIKNLSDSRIAISSFVKLPALSETDKVGLAIEERLVHEMYTRGFQVIDYKLTGSLRVRSSGDFVYSRLPSDLKNEHNIQYFLTGVIEIGAEGYVIHARLVEAASSLVVSSAQAFLPARDVLKLLDEIKNGDGMKIVIDKPIPAKVVDNRVRVN